MVDTTEHVWAEPWVAVLVSCSVAMMAGGKVASWVDSSVYETAG